MSRLFPAAPLLLTYFIAVVSVFTVDIHAEVRACVRVECRCLARVSLGRVLEALPFPYVF